MKKIIVIILSALGLGVVVVAVAIGTLFYHAHNRNLVPDPTCIASDKLRIQVADRLFQIPREYAGVTENITRDKGQPSHPICQRSSDPPINVNEFVVNPINGHDGEKKLGFTAQIHVHRLDSFNKKLSTPVYSPEIIGKPSQPHCASFSHVKVPGNPCEVFFAWSDEVIVRYIFMDGLEPLDHWPKLHEKIVAFLTLTDKTNKPKFASHN